MFESHTSHRSQVKQRNKLVILSTTTTKQDLSVIAISMDEFERDKMICDCCVFGSASQRNLIWIIERRKIIQCRCIVTDNTCSNRCSYKRESIHKCYFSNSDGPVCMSVCSELTVHEQTRGDSSLMFVFILFENHLVFLSFSFRFVCSAMRFCCDFLATAWRLPCILFGSIWYLHTQ